MLAGLLGFVGWPEVVAGLFAGFVIGAVVALVLVAARRTTMRSAIAFGPMLVLGALLVLAARGPATASPAPVACPRSLLSCHG